MRPDAHTLVAAYAVDALDEPDSADVRDHLAQCEACRDDLRGLRETLAVLAGAAGETPPPRMRETVLARARMTPQLPPLPADATGPGDADMPADATGPGDPTGPADATGPADDTRPADDAGPTDVSVAADTGTRAGRAHRARTADGAGGSSTEARRAGRPSSTTLFALAASALTVVALAAGAWGITSADRLEDVRAQQAAVQRVLASGDLTTLSGTPQLTDGVRGGEVVVLASESADAALLLPAGLPVAPEGSTWQAWTLSGEDATPAGVFDVADGEAVALEGGVAGVDAVAVTLEPSGGSPVPTSDPVLVVPLV